MRKGRMERRRERRDKRKRGEEVLTILTPLKCDLGTGAVGQDDRHSRLHPTLLFRGLPHTEARGPCQNQSHKASERLRSETRKTTSTPRRFPGPLCDTSLP